MSNDPCHECGTPLESNSEQQKEYGWNISLKLKGNIKSPSGAGVGSEAGTSSPANENISKKESGYCSNITDCEQAREDAIKQIKEAGGWAHLPREDREQMSNVLFKQEHKDALQNLNRNVGQLDDEYLKQVNEAIENTRGELNSRIKNRLSQEANWKTKMRSLPRINNVPDEIKDINQMREQYERLSERVQEQVQTERKQNEQSVSESEDTSIKNNRSHSEDQINSKSTDMQADRSNSQGMSR